MAYYIPSKDRWGVSFREPGTGRKRLRTFRSRREAELFQAELRVDPERKQPERQGQRTVIDAMRDYYKQGSHQQVTRKMDRYKPCPCAARQRETYPADRGHAARERQQKLHDQSHDGHPAFSPASCEVQPGSAPPQGRPCSHASTNARGSPADTGSGAAARLPRDCAGVQHWHARGAV